MRSLKHLTVTCLLAGTWFFVTLFLLLGYSLGRPYSSEFDFITTLVVWGGVFCIFWFREARR